jgi:hypothetical protein
MTRAAADPNRLHALGASLREFMLRAKGSLDDEIRSYPTPIPRCDAQFNHAYEQRSRLAALLRQIDAASSGDVAANDLLRAMAEFSALPSIGQSGEEHWLRVRIADALASAGMTVMAGPDSGTIDLTADGH